ncbi:MULTISPECIES: D-glycero-beta-D-manno-heptose 1,7-bisphosphate 7-phosphatase [Thiomicrorhabdus]|uniref:D,D-heptose 1,7-bisphosphate phosphatase n=1 Tax=Thiomicrorhabdus heinhorstiae TaxID=2748010 RepID=A0ABS0BWY7_9GAMM|nr:MULTISPECIES: D-glycero-beta-D-manno-heptose 1,7-bisphosphate 7-phosphatase [Thiomicrorhabdus]MBF6058318.1 D-glycero-beta-D-manno-heptose 1,7-bisphosphate 7-phosphatase [Thiomicrorhabdus heinhorstiae]
MHKIIVLDRDGVINEDSDAFIKSAEEWIPVEGSMEAIRALKQAGWTVAIATNQSGIKRGYYDRATLSSMHQKMNDLLEDCKPDWISYSPYLSGDNSPSRKPQTGMMQAIEKALNVDLKGAPFVGDTLADIQAARSMSMQPYLVRSGKGERTLATQDPMLQGVEVFDNLQALVEYLLAHGA